MEDHTILKEQKRIQREKEEREVGSKEILDEYIR